MTGKFGTNKNRHGKRTHCEWPVNLQKCSYLPVIKKTQVNLTIKWPLTSEKKQNENKWLYSRLVLSNYRFICLTICLSTGFETT